MALPMLLLAACAQTGTWQNPDVPEAQWAADKAACQAFAEQQAERDFALSQQTGRSLDYDRGGQWSTQMNRYSAGRERQRQFEACMQQRGYRLVSPDADAEAKT